MSDLLVRLFCTHKYVRCVHGMEMINHKKQGKLPKKKCLVCSKYLYSGVRPNFCSMTGRNHSDLFLAHNFKGRL